MIFQVKTTRQKCNQIISMYAAWQAQKMYESWSCGKAEGRSVLSSMHWSCCLATAAPSAVRLLACDILHQILKQKESWAYYRSPCWVLIWLWHHLKQSQSFFILQLVYHSLKSPGLLARWVPALPALPSEPESLGHHLCGLWNHSWATWHWEELRICTLECCIGT